MEGHKFMKKPIIKDLKIDKKTKQGPYYLRRIHLFYKNECILEIDVTGFIHSINPLSNYGDISFHVDAGSDLMSLAPKGSMTGQTKKRKKKRRKKK